MSDSENETENENNDEFDLQDREENQDETDDETDDEENLEAMLDFQNEMIRYIRKEKLPIAENITIELLLQMANDIAEEFNK